MRIRKARVWATSQVTGILCALHLLSCTGARATGQATERIVRMAARPVTSEGDSARVPGKRVDGLLVIPVSINGLDSVWVAVDTGAEGHLHLSERLVRRLELPVAGRIFAVDGSRRNARELTTYHVDALEIGGVLFREVVAVDFPNTMAGVNGLLGMHLFTDFLLTLDFPRAELSLSRDSLPRPGDSRVVAYTGGRSPVSVTLSAGERQIQATLDTGNCLNAFVLPMEFVIGIPWKDEPRPGGVLRSISNEYELQLVTLAIPLQLDRFLYADQVVAFAPDETHAQVGVPALGRLVIEIDQKNRRLRLTKRPRPR